MLFASNNIITQKQKACACVKIHTSTYSYNIVVCTMYLQYSAIYLYSCYGYGVLSWPMYMHTDVGTAGVVYVCFVVDQQQPLVV